MFRPNEEFILLLSVSARINGVCVCDGLATGGCITCLWSNVYKASKIMNRLMKVSIFNVFRTGCLTMWNLRAQPVVVLRILLCLLKIHPQTKSCRRLSFLLSTTSLLARSAAKANTRNHFNQELSMNYNCACPTKVSCVSGVFTVHQSFVYKTAVLSSGNKSCF